MTKSCLALFFMKKEIRLPFLKFCVKSVNRITKERAIYQDKNDRIAIFISKTGKTVIFQKKLNGNQYVMFLAITLQVFGRKLINK